MSTSLLTGLQIDEVIARYGGSGNRTLLTDALGSVIAEARSDATVATRREYTPYGQSVSSGEASSNDNQYTARENDGTGLYFYRARYYDAQLKRFVLADPIGLDGGMNTYAYAANSPIRFIDPLGLSPQSCGSASGNDNKQLDEYKKYKEKKFDGCRNSCNDLKGGSARAYCDIICAIDASFTPPSPSVPLPPR